MDNLKKILNDIFGISIEDINNESSLEDMGLDSISIVEFQVEIERSLHLNEGKLALTSDDTLLTIMNKFESLN